MRLKAWKKQILILFAVLLLLFSVVGGLWASNLLGWRTWRIQEVQSFLGATLPAEAGDVHFATQNQKTRIVWLRFALPAGNDLSPFLAQMGITDALRSGFTPFPAPNPQEAAYSWWDAPTATDFAGLYDNTGQKIIEILQDNARHLIFVRAYNIASG